jgi:hypothetical protein
VDKALRRLRKKLDREQNLVQVRLIAIRKAGFSKTAEAKPARF